MFHVGLDIHSTRITICVLGETGQVVHRAQVRTVEEMLVTLKGLPDRFEVCYEASCGYGHYHDVLRPLAARVLVAHPGHLRLIFRSKNKNDRNDAERLAKLLYLGETPTVHVPSAEIRAFMQQPETKKKISELGAVAMDVDGPEFGKYIASETSRWKGVIEKANITMN